MWSWLCPLSARGIEIDDATVRLGKFSDRFAKYVKILNKFFK